MAEGMSWALALGAAAPKTSVVVGGHKFVLSPDAPGILADVERQCLEWGRKTLADFTAGLPDRNRPGTIDHAAAEDAVKRFGADVAAGEFCPPGGKRYAEFAATTAGRLALLVAVLTPDQPGITAADVMRMFVVAPDAMRAVCEEVKNSVDAQERALRA